MAGIPGDQIGPLMHQLVPLVATLGLEYADVSADRAVVVLRDVPEYRNHVGGPHAAVVFAAGESATGAVAIAVFGDLLDRAVLLPVTVTMDYLTIALGDLTATAVIVDDVAAAPVGQDGYALVTADPGGSSPEDVVAALVGAGVGVAGFEVSRPSLEDLFVALTGEGFDVGG